MSAVEKLAGEGARRSPYFTEEHEALRDQVRRFVETEIKPHALKWEEDGLVLFETGAIVLHIAERHAGLLPADTNARARAISWMFCALNTVEPPVLDRQVAIFMEGNESWHQQRLPKVDGRIRDRLGELSIRLGDADWLDGDFSAGDLLMVTVLRRLNMSGLLRDYPNLDAYVTRGEARPAFRRAFAAQLAVFTAASAGD